MRGMANIFKWFKNVLNGPFIADVPPELLECEFERRPSRKRNGHDSAVNSRASCRFVISRCNLAIERGGTGRTEDFSRVKIGAVPPSQMVDVVIAGNDGKMLEARAQIRAGGEKAFLINATSQKDIGHATKSSCGKRHEDTECGGLPRHADIWALGDGLVGAGGGLDGSALGLCDDRQRHFGVRHRELRTARYDPMLWRRRCRPGWQACLRL